MSFGASKKIQGQQHFVPASRIFIYFIACFLDPQADDIVLVRGLFHQPFQGRLFGFNGRIDFLGYGSCVCLTSLQDMKIGGKMNMTLVHFKKEQFFPI